MSRNRPSNWYEMGYEAQRAWDKQERAREDAEHEADRAREDAERIARDARHQKEECEAERYRHQEAVNEYVGELDEAQERVGDLEETIAELIAASEAFVKWDDANRSLDVPQSIGEGIRAAIAKAKAKV